VNINGVLSFSESFGVFSPRSLPFGSVPLIIPFWRDTITRSDCPGNIYYRETANSDALEQASLILHGIGLRRSFNPTSVFIATWDDVTSYGSRVDCGVSNPAVNTFQAVLMANEEMSFVAFLYDDIQWGSSAQIGFDFGDGTDHTRCLVV